LYSLYYMLFSSMAHLSHCQGEINRRENKLYTCVPDSFLVYLLYFVPDHVSDEPKHVGENYM
jgi:hypothetical protein